jgi:hypothetical protein
VTWRLYWRLIAILQARPERNASVAGGHDARAPACQRGVIPASPPLEAEMLAKVIHGHVVRSSRQARCPTAVYSTLTATITRSRVTIPVA